MAKLVDKNNIQSLCDSIEDIDMYSILTDIADWRDAKSTSASVALTLDSVIDIIIEHCLWLSV